MAKKFRTIEEMREVYARYKSSNLRMADFCKGEKISQHTFKYWLRKIEKPNAPPPGAGFQQILPSAAGQDFILLRLSDGRSLELPADYPPKQLLQILRGLSC